MQDAAPEGLSVCLDGDKCLVLPREERAAD